MHLELASDCLEGGSLMLRKVRACLNADLGEPSVVRETTNRSQLGAFSRLRERATSVLAMSNLQREWGFDGGATAGRRTDAAEERRAAEEAQLVEVAHAEALTAEWQSEHVAARQKFQPGAHRPVPLAFHVSTQYGEHLVPLGSVRLDLRAALDALERAPSTPPPPPPDFGGLTSSTTPTTARPSLSFTDDGREEVSGTMRIDERLVWCGVVCGHVRGTLRLRAPAHTLTRYDQPPSSAPPSSMLRRAKSSLERFVSPDPSRQSSAEVAEASSPCSRPASEASSPAKAHRSSLGFKTRRLPRPCGSVRFSQPETCWRDSRQLDAASSSSRTPDSTAAEAMPEPVEVSRSKTY